MLGLMQDWPLTIPRIIDHAARQHGSREVVSRSVEGPIHRTTYAQVRARSLRVAKRLVRDGVRAGDRVATLAWNTWRHLEAWYGIAGIGAIYHTVNPRLFPDQIAWILNHAEDEVVLVDLTFVPLLEGLAARLPRLRRVVVLTDGAHMPATTLVGAISYEEWIGEVDDDFAWIEVGEGAAAGLCYTSGTTGEPKGVLYSHRSNVLHAMVVAAPDALCLGSSQTILPVVPLFHANSWSIAFCAPMTGAKMVMPGAKLDGASLYALIEAEGVTVSAAVPTIWLMLLQHVQREKLAFSTMRRVMIGGSACPQTMIEVFERDYGVSVFHAWGMTEMSPVGSLGTLKHASAGLDQAETFKLKAKQGWAPFSVEMKITDDDGRPLPWDGHTFGRLKVAGPAVARAYYRIDEPILDADGFFDTGDVATIDSDGYMQVTDRAKDVIKSGGEWISSIELENLAVGHPDVTEAAVIGVAHAKWDERPLLVVVPKPGRVLDRADVLAFLAPKVARWWLPDDVQVVEAIPHTATGKINKRVLREQFKDYRLPEPG